MQAAAMLDRVQRVKAVAGSMVGFIWVSLLGCSGSLGYQFLCPNPHTSSIANNSPVDVINSSMKIVESGPEGTHVSKSVILWVRISCSSGLHTVLYMVQFLGFRNLVNVLGSNKINHSVGYTLRAITKVLMEGSFQELDAVLSLFLLLYGVFGTIFKDREIGNIRSGMLIPRLVECVDIDMDGW